MILRPREPDRRRFTSHLRARRTRQREYYYASFMVLVVKIILFIFLWILFSVSIRLFRYRFADSPPLQRYILPVLIGIFAIALGYFIYKNIKDLIELSRENRKKRLKK